MQKIAATNKIIDIDTTTAFVSPHTCSNSFEKDYDKKKHVNYKLY